MGHSRLAVLPRSKKWLRVVELLGSGAATVEVVAATYEAAHKDLLHATDDPVFVESIRLLLSIPLAARSADFGQALRDIDLPVPHRPELVDILAAVTERLDATRSTTRARSDLGELAARALTRTLAGSIGDALPGLFTATPEEVQAVARKLSWSNGISEFSRRFFGHLIADTLAYWLDRALAVQVGTEGRFRDAAGRGTFDVELDHYASQATRIIKEFSGGWYGKTLNREGGFSSRQAAAFGSVALRKIVDELRVRESTGA